MFDRLFFEQLLKLHLNLPKQTRWFSVFVEAGKDPHVVVGYHKEDDAENCWGFHPDCKPTTYITSFTLGERMIDWWVNTGRDLGTPRAVDINRLRMKCTGTMAEWWSLRGWKIRRAI